MIDDQIFRRLKQKAAAEGRTLQEVVNEALRRALAERSERTYTLSLRGWAATQQPGVDITDRDKLFDLMDGR
jgi:plasmid stability protein